MLTLSQTIGFCGFRLGDQPTPSKGRLIEIEMDASLPKKTSEHIHSRLPTDRFIKEKIAVTVEDAAAPHFSVLVRLIGFYEQG